MAKPRNRVEQEQADPTEPLGDQLVREAREGQAAFAAGWKEFVDGLGVRGEPMGARQLREMLLREGVQADDNAFSRGIVALREESP